MRSKQELPRHKGKARSNTVPVPEKTCHQSFTQNIVSVESSSCTGVVADAESWNGILKY